MKYYKSLNNRFSFTIISLLGVITLGSITLSATTPEENQQLTAELAVTPQAERILIAASTDTTTDTLHNYNPRYPDPVYEDTNLEQTSAEIQAIQQQITAQMDACIQDARAAHTQLVALKQQQEEIDTAIDQLRDQRRAIPYTDEDREVQQELIDAQIDELRNQKDALRDGYNENRRTSRKAVSDCRRVVRDLQRTKSALERQLDKQFRESVYIRV